MSTAIVPQIIPATVVKNSDGTYSVRIQHTAEGSYTEVQFHNHVFGETLAKGYAAFLNGEAKVEAEIEKLTPKVKTDLTDVRKAGEAALTKAEADAQKIVDDAKVQVTKIIADASVVAEGIKADAEKILADAKVEAAKIKSEADQVLEDAQTKAKDGAIVEAPAPEATDETK